VFEVNQCKLALNATGKLTHNGQNMRSNLYKDIAQHVANKTRDKENWR